jgi:hypothetical protein
MKKYKENNKVQKKKKWVDEFEENIILKDGNTRDL